MSDAAAPAGTRPRSDLLVRTVTGLILIAVALGCVAVGGHYFWALLLAASLLMVTEWASMLRAQRWQIWLMLAGTTFGLLFAMPAAEVPDYAAPVMLAVATLVVMAATRRPRLSLGLLYAGLPSAALAYLNAQFDGFGLTLWTLAIVWATDIGAYFAGRSIGGPKLAPTLSPNKTWAGLIGGMLSAELIGLALAHALHAPGRLVGFAGLLAIAAQAGDLYESAMKRRAGVKDSGHILPGHGGVMDRLDGVVPVSCLMAVIVMMGAV